jgi:ferredoxin-NADP reductase
VATTATPELAPAPGRHWSGAAIRSVRDVAADVRMIEIEPAGGARPYPTGSHLDIAVVVDGLPDVRS